jgi:hypothetical protein
LGYPARFSFTLFQIILLAGAHASLNLAKGHLTLLESTEPFMAPLQLSKAQERKGIVLGVESGHLTRLQWWRRGTLIDDRFFKAPPGSAG